jgi:flavorubredoxin
MSETRGQGATNMRTSVAEISDGIYRISTFIEQAGICFNQFLIQAEEPLLFHCGFHKTFGNVSEAVSRLMPVERLRWISFGHHEADESGAMNDWLAVAPIATIAAGRLSCGLSVSDQALREPRILEEGEILDLGGKKVTYISTPHVPHAWDAGLLYEITTNTLLCGDLFAQVGECESITRGDIVGPALKTEDMSGATSNVCLAAVTVRKLADLSPSVLALMHGPAYQGDGGSVLQGLAEGYEDRCRMWHG